MKRTILIFIALMALTAWADDRRISLAGTWQFALGSNMPQAFDETVTLPGTTDTNQKGMPLNRFDETTHLSRRYSYKGRAWYQREITIPDNWEEVWLTLERTKYTEVYVDGKRVGCSNDISTPQRYDLTAQLTPGLTHILTIMVSNAEGVPEQIYANSHAYTEDTQTNWNGIIGDISLSWSRELDLCPLTSTSESQLLTIKGQHLFRNGHRLFLRGRHDACVWPLTGHVPMDVESWQRYMKTCTDYGLNHVRFHSWCPPEAAFVAADEAGIILQPELPFWGDFNAEDSVLMIFLHKEGEHILHEYGHHKSFRMFALGNELWGSIEKMAEFVEDFRKIAPDKLYTFGSNYYLGYQGVKPSMDYFTTCRVGGEAWGSYDTHTRGSFSFADAYDGGMINHFRPNASMNFEEGCQKSAVPVISHETGQFQVYPNYDEINKYTGVLRPCNLEVFRQRLSDAGMADLAHHFHRASGRWAFQLYKQDVEMDLRTPSMVGFQLLDLQDYPGQGSAYVGMLDAFLDSKGICTPEEWRQFSSEVVPLAVMKKFCYKNSEMLDVEIQIANYSGQSLRGKTVSVTLDTPLSSSPSSPSSLLPPLNTDEEGLIRVGRVSLPLSSYRQPERLELTLAVSGTDYRNSWPIWVYPDKQELKANGIVIAHELTDALCQQLERGARVLLMPDSASLCVGGLFQTDYWNYRMFRTICENNKKPVSPGTLGILCDPEHPLFALFPTEEHTNWQWWPVIHESHPMILDGASIQPIVQVIDNVERNHKLGLVFELAVGKGCLFVVMSHLERAADYPEGRQFYASVLNYLQSDRFSPATHLTPDALRRLFTREVKEEQREQLNNISPY